MIAMSVCWQVFRPFVKNPFVFTFRAQDWSQEFFEFEAWNEKKKFIYILLSLILETITTRSHLSNYWSIFCFPSHELWIEFSIDKKLRFVGSFVALTSEALYYVIV